MFSSHTPMELVLTIPISAKFAATSLIEGSYWYQNVQQVSSY